MGNKGGKIVRQHGAAPVNTFPVGSWECGMGSVEDSPVKDMQGHHENSKIR